MQTSLKPLSSLRLLSALLWTLGVGQLVWIVTQVLMLRGVSWLHFLFGGIGMATGWVALEPRFRAYPTLKTPAVSRGQA